jgi:hypothetical protein
MKAAKKKAERMARQRMAAKAHAAAEGRECPHTPGAASFFAKIHDQFGGFSHNAFGKMDGFHDSTGLPETEDESSSEEEREEGDASSEDVQSDEGKDPSWRKSKQRKDGSDVAEESMWTDVDGLTPGGGLKPAGIVDPRDTRKQNSRRTTAGKNTQEIRLNEMVLEEDGEEELPDWMFDSVEEEDDSSPSFPSKDDFSPSKDSLLSTPEDDAVNGNKESDHVKDVINTLIGGGGGEGGEEKKKKNDKKKNNKNNSKKDNKKKDNKDFYSTFHGEKGTKTGRWLNTAPRRKSVEAKMAASEFENGFYKSKENGRSSKTTGRKSTRKSARNSGREGRAYWGRDLAVLLDDFGEQDSETDSDEYTEVS